MSCTSNNTIEEVHIGSYKAYNVNLFNTHNPFRKSAGTGQAIMTKSQLNDALKDLNTRLLQLGNLVVYALQDALLSLEKRDENSAQTIIAADDKLDTLRMEIEELAIHLLASQTFSKQHLRFIMSTLTIAGTLERIGDGAAGIAKMQLNMRFKSDGKMMDDRDPLEVSGYMAGTSILQGILSLGWEAIRVLQETLQAFAKRDVQVARHIWQEDDVVDVRYHMVRHDLMCIMEGNQAIAVLQNDPYSLQRATYLLWIAHKLERVADHCTNICERIVFIKEGENVIVASDDL